MKNKDLDIKIVEDADMKLESISCPTDDIHLADPETVQSDEPKNYDDLFEQILEEESSTEKMLELIEEQEHLFIKPKSFKPILGSDILFESATHLIAGASKEGKTTYAIDELGKATGKTVIVLDGDGNGIDAVSKAGANIHWQQPKEPYALLELYLSLIKEGKPFDDVIFLIDSLQNFTGKYDIDSNDGMKHVISTLKKLTNTGATLVVLHHITEKGKDGFKLKGNSEALYSQCDISYGYTRDEPLQVLKSRITGVLNDTEIGHKTIPIKTPKSLGEMMGSKK